MPRGGRDVARYSFDNKGGIQLLTLIPPGKVSWNIVCLIGGVRLCPRYLTKEVQTLVTMFLIFEGLAQLAVVLGMLGMSLLMLGAFAVYLFVLPTSIQVHAPLLDGPALPTPKE